MADGSKQQHFITRRVVLGALVVFASGAITVIAAMVLGLDPTAHAIGLAAVAQVISLGALLYFLRRWARQDREAAKLFD